MSVGAKLTIISGVPGAGKTAGAVDVLRAYIDEGRKVYTCGLNAPAFEQSTLTVDELHRWHEPGVVEDGCIILVDEAQDVWPAAPAGSKVPPDLYELARHRHRGISFVLTTQAAGMLHSRVRDLCGQFVLIRNLGVLGRKWYEWPECPKQISFKAAPIQHRYKLPSRVFKLYKSSSLHVKHKATVPRAVIALALALVGLGVVVYMAWGSINAKMNGGTAKKPPASGGLVTSSSAAQSQPQQLVRVPVLFVGPAVKDREPYGGLGVHLAGLWTVAGQVRAMFTLTVDGRSVGSVTDAEMRKAGYGWRTSGVPCSMVLTWGDRERFVTCDAPQQNARAASPALSASSADGGL